MFPYAARSFPGYRLLTEFFTFPQKFLFVDLAGLDRQALRKLDSRCEIYVYLNRSLVDLEQNVDCGDVPTRLHADREPVSAAGRADRAVAPRQRVPRRARCAASAGP